jgi:hypothetical protein
MAEPVGDTVVDPDADHTPLPDDTPRTFTQEDVDRIVKERVARAKAKPPDDYEELKAAASRLAELEEAQKTELERAQARADAADKERERVVAEAQEYRVRSAILTEAAKPDRKVVDPDLVASLLGPDLEFDDDGNPTNVAKAMDSLLEARPYLVVSDGGTRKSADLGARAGGTNQLSESEYQALSPAEKVQARKEGRLVSLGIGA